MPTHRHALRAAAAVVAAAAACHPALAQEAINTPAATQPSAGKFVLREQLRLTRLDEDPAHLDRTIEQVTLWTRLSYGVTGNLSLSLDAPLVFRDVEVGETGGSDDVSGLGGLSLSAKLRVYRHDFGPIDTLRASVLAGLEIPLGSDHLGIPSVAPVIGGVATYVHGRHGLNAAARWTFTTGSVHHPVMPGESLSDLLRYDLAYLYRALPEQYSTTNTDALYGVLELNGFYETNGDHQLFLSPGIMYEARRWAAEVSVQLPIEQDLDHRPETDYSIVLGLRFLF